MADINYTFFLSLTIIAIGFIVKKLKIITEEGGKSIAKLILNVINTAVRWTSCSQCSDFIFFVHT
jgi:hypothetical protein